MACHRRGFAKQHRISGQITLREQITERQHQQHGIKDQVQIAMRLAIGKLKRSRQTGHDGQRCKHRANHENKHNDGLIHAALLSGKLLAKSIRGDCLTVPV